jgi:predicted ATPase
MKIVFTGGPRCGKTTSIEKLALRGLTTVPEAARMVILEEQKKDSDCLPWRNLYLFQQKVAKIQLEQEHSYHDKILGLDRGIVDCHGYSLQGKIPTPEVILRNGKNRYVSIFLFDAIPDYKPDEVRKESPEKARELQNCLRQGYQDFGYPVYRIPVFAGKTVEDAIEKRVDYVAKLLERMI